jgi:hypothetical protein
MMIHWAASDSEVVHDNTAHITMKTAVATA